MPRPRHHVALAALAALAAAQLLGCPADDGASETDTTTSGTTGTTTSSTSGTSTPSTTDAETDATTTEATTTTGGGTTTTDGTTTDASTTDDSTTGVQGPPTVLLPKLGLAPEELAVLVNTEDPVSVEVAAYYLQARQIPPQNLLELSFPTGAVLTPELFAPLKAQVDALGPQIQGLALTWTQPYRVGCMSITTAFALGFDPKYCSQPCNPTAPSPYYNSESLAPFTDHQLRPAMSLAAAGLSDALALIDRGVAADDTFPTGDGYFLRTTDVPRSVRYPDFMATVAAWSQSGALDLTYNDNADGQGQDYLSGKQGLLFYLTGLASVPEIQSNTFLPGAVADHLTSYGGQIPDSGQMSVVRWLEAGATASYGTVVEPCNYPTKFPAASVLLPHYFRGQTVIEAYWKSVAWPGEGIFVGEPLARPWGHRTAFEGGALTITTTALSPGKIYQVDAAPAADGPWEPVLKDISVPTYKRLDLLIDPATSAYYRLVLAD
ncbi:MAG: TIGR03790 family protein [Nannocystis sp.]|nr:TIGR03790 family protein [Nannocystis sp.]